MDAGRARMPAVRGVSLRGRYHEVPAGRTLGRKADWERHRTAKAFSEIYAPKVLPLVDRTPHISTLVE